MRPFKIPCYPQLRKEWELLSFSDDSILFNSIFGPKIRITKLTLEIKKIITLCNGTNSINSIQKKTQIDKCTIEAIIGELALKKILTEPIEEGLDPKIATRFNLVIESFSRFETEDIKSFDFFNRIRETKVSIIGAGGNGSLIAMMCAASGVKNIHIIDGDTVDSSNLVRQIFYTQKQSTQKKLKVDAIKEAVENLSSFTQVKTTAEFINSTAQAKKILTGSDFIFMCADAPRILINRWINRAALELDIPHIGAFSGSVGPLTLPFQTACFSCVENTYRESLGEIHDQIVDSLQIVRSRQYPSFVTGPVLTAHLQFQEFIGYVTKAWNPDSLKGTIQTHSKNLDLCEIPRDPQCPECKKGLL